MQLLTGLRRALVPALLPCAVVLAGCGRGERVSGGTTPEAERWYGIYESDTLPGAVQPRLLRAVIGPDTVATVSVEYVGLGTTFHPGHWWARGDRLTLQPTRSDGAPSELPFTWRREGDRLVPLAWDKRVYGDEEVPLTKQAPPADSTAGGTR